MLVRMTSLADARTPAEAAALIRLERNRRGWTARDLAEKIREAASITGEDIDLTQQAISFFETGKAKSLPRWLRHAHFAFVTDDVAQRDALTAPGHGNAGADDVFLSPAEMGLVKISEIDLDIGMGAAFMDEPEVTEVDRWIPQEWVSNFTNTPAPLLAIARPTGDSMYPTINDRDLVLIDRSQTRIDRADAIWLLVFGGFSTIKRVRMLPDGTARLMADNPQVRDETATDGELFVIGRIAGVFRRA